MTSKEAVRVTQREFEALVGGELSKQRRRSDLRNYGDGSVEELDTVSEETTEDDVADADEADEAYDDHGDDYDDTESEEDDEEDEDYGDGSVEELDTVSEETTEVDVTDADEADEDYDDHSNDYDETETEEDDEEDDDEDAAGRRRAEDDSELVGGYWGGGGYDYGNGEEGSGGTGGGGGSGLDHGHNDDTMSVMSAITNETIVFPFKFRSPKPAPPNPEPILIDEDGFITSSTSDDGSRTPESEPSSFNPSVIDWPAWNNDSFFKAHHYRRCRNAKCPTCAPVREIIQNSQKVAAAIRIQIFVRRVMQPQQGPEDGARQKAATFVNEMRRDEQVQQEEDSMIIEDRKVMGRVLANRVVCDPISVSFKYLKHCTNDFSKERLLGTGSSSQVYMGKDDSLRKKFAVKLLRVKFLADVDVEEAVKTFQREIETLKYFRHANICRLYAYSLSKDLRGSQCLVFEYASNGCLSSFLSQQSTREKLHWTTRINIALDVAKALEYMHKGVSGQICYHRDVKSPNICLRRNYKALLIDCGTSKLVPEDESNSTMTIMESGGDGLRGTRGYICPMYARLMRGYTSASEVFSLGIVMIELFTGKIQNSRVEGVDVDLFDLYSKDGAERRNLEDCADTDAGEWDDSIMCELAILLVDCISISPSKRPSIGDVVLFLGKLAARSRGWTPGERNSIKVLTAEPLVWCDKENGNALHPISAPLNFKLERELIVHCIKETKRNIEISFDIANDDRIMSAASRRYGCLHFSGHGYDNCLLFEDERGGAHFLGAKELYDSVHKQPFKFVFVSACYSEFMGEALVQAGVPHVVCCKHNAELNDDAALKFTKNFYLALIDGYTIQAAFDKGRQAVSKRFGITEVDKFVLLPQNGNHDIPLFDAEVLDIEEEIIGNEQEPFIPVPPKPFIGRELDIYCLLQKVISERFVTLIGTEGVGCSSVASALSHYIQKRKNVILDIENVYFVRRKEGDAMLSTWNTFILPFHEQLVSEGRAQRVETDYHKESFQNIFDALKGTSVLLVLDGVIRKDSVLIEFLMSLFERTNSVKVLVTAHSPIGIWLSNVTEHKYCLSPLSFESAVNLFGQLCPHTETHAKRDKLSEKGLECQKRKVFFSEQLGSGNPSKIVRAAGEVSREELEYVTRE